MTVVDAIPRRRGSVVSTTVAEVVVLGLGHVGRTVLSQLLALHDARVRVVGVADSTGYRYAADGFDAASLSTLIADKAAGVSVGSAATADVTRLIGAVVARSGAPRIVIDATATDTTPLLLQALAGGCDIVLANKVPLVGSRDALRALYDAAAIHGRQIRHEATVGAGLPVIETVHKLLDAGDTITAVEGCPSGTLGYVFAELARGVPFSQAVRAAHAAGYTEPDPRLDLSGIDVARKALILGRLLGFDGDLDAVATEPLLDASWQQGSVADFLGRLSAADAAWAARVADAAASGCVLRYRIRVTPSSVAAGVVAIPVGGALAALDGTDNQFSFTTARYDTRPLVITGPGAGAAVTAAGVVGDLLSVLR